jgi:hypothetical protein
MRGSSLQQREGALIAAGRFAFFSGFCRGAAQPHCLPRRVIRVERPASWPARWGRLQFIFIAMAVGGTGLFPVPADSAGPTAVTVTATGTITCNSATSANLVGKAYTVYISFPASVLNNANLGTIIVRSPAVGLQSLSTSLVIPQLAFPEIFQEITQHLRFTLPQNC